MKRYFDGLIATEISRQELIDALNKVYVSNEAQILKKDLRSEKIKNLILRGYIESLENKKNDDLGLKKAA